MGLLWALSPEAFYIVGFNYCRDEEEVHCPRVHLANQEKLDASSEQSVGTRAQEFNEDPRFDLSPVPSQEAVHLYGHR